MENPSPGKLWKKYIKLISECCLAGWLVGTGFDRFSISTAAQHTERRGREGAREGVAEKCVVLNEFRARGKEGE